MWVRVGRVARAADRARGGLALDAALYAVFALFATYTAMASTLTSHRVWGATAIAGYALAAVVALTQLSRADHRLAGTRARAWVVGVTWATTALLPLVIGAYQRAAGTPGRAQEEVIVIEEGGQRLIETGTPYLSRAAIGALDAPDQLLGYLPYQPAMAWFGLARAADPEAHWWSDARVWFAVVTALALGTALYVLRRAGSDPARLVRGAQATTVLPLCALALATGGDDLPVLGLCLLAFALAAVRRWGWAGFALGGAVALKLFAWPVALVLGILAVTRGRRAVLHLAAATAGLPALTLTPALYIDASAFVENVLRFPLGHGLVVSPAQSPLPGYLIAAIVPHGRYVALGLLAAAGLAIAVRLARRPPRTASAAAVASGVGLLVALVLLSATRFGYLLYPVAFLVWAGCLRAAAPALPRVALPRVPRQTRRSRGLDQRRRSRLAERLAVARPLLRHDNGAPAQVPYARRQEREQRRHGDEYRAAEHAGLRADQGHRRAGEEHADRPEHERPERVVRADPR